MTIDPRITDLYDEYTHAPLARRVFLRRLSGLAGGSAAAAALLAKLDNAYADQVKPQDPRLESGYLTYSNIRSYYAKALAPDMHSPLGGAPKDPDAARALHAKLDHQQTIANLVAAVDYLASRNDIGKIGALGFCWGGGMVNQLAVHSPKLAATAPFYGEVPTGQQWRSGL